MLTAIKPAYKSQAELSPYDWNEDEVAQGEMLLMRETLRT